MNRNINKGISKKLCVLGFGLLQCGLAGIWLPAAAHQPVSNRPVSNHIAQSDLPPALVFNQANTPSSFERQGRPSRRTSGGSRGECHEQLIALLPGSDSITPANSTAACGSVSMSAPTATLSAFPTLWFYIPPQDLRATAELALLDENAQALSVETIGLPAGSGIVGIQLPLPLAVGQTHQWVFSLLQHPNAPSQNPRVEGIVQRVPVTDDLVAALTVANGSQGRAQVFAQAGIWQDALDEIAQLRRADPTDVAVQASWVSLLSSVGLEAIAQTDLLSNNPKFTLEEP